VSWSGCQYVLWKSRWIEPVVNSCKNVHVAGVTSQFNCGALVFRNVWCTPVVSVQCREAPERGSSAGVLFPPCAFIYLVGDGQSSDLSELVVFTLVLSMDKANLELRQLVWGYRSSISYRRKTHHEATADGAPGSLLLSHGLAGFVSTILLSTSVSSRKGRQDLVAPFFRSLAYSLYSLGG